MSLSRSQLLRVSLIVPPFALSTRSAHAARRLEGVNAPELLPTRAPGEPAKLALDVGGWLTPRQLERIERVSMRIERDTGVRLRVLAQNYPLTPGKAVVDYWNVDENTVVLVADPGLGNALHFSVGSNVDGIVPTSFWSRIEGRYGSSSYWKRRGVDVSIESAVAAVDACLKEPQDAVLRCTKLPNERDDPLGYVA